MEKRKEHRPDFQYRTGDTYYYFGDPVVLKMEPSTRKRATIKIRDDQMIITLYQRIILLQEEKIYKRKRFLVFLCSLFEGKRDLRLFVLFMRN